MRVSIDCRYVRNRPSGIGHYVQALVDRIPGLSPKDTFHLWVNPDVDRPLTRFANVSEGIVGAPPNSLPTLAWPFFLMDLSRMDLLHAPFNILGWGLSCPTVVTVHDLIWVLAPQMAEGWSLRTPFQALFYRQGILRALRRAARIITVSQAAADSIFRFFPKARDRVRVIHHGVESYFTSPKNRDAVRCRAASLIGNDRPYFLVVGQNAPYKNYRMTLEAFAAANLSSIQLVFVERLYGDRGLLRLARRLNVEDRVLFVRDANRDDVIVLMQAAVALIQFSLMEGFGMPALEAMACGTPVIASDIPPLKEILGDAGVTVPLQVSLLAPVLARVAREPGWRLELGERGVERARDFSWDRAAKLHLEVYREAASLGPSVKKHLGDDTRRQRAWVASCFSRMTTWKITPSPPSRPR